MLHQLWKMWPTNENFVAWDFVSNFKVYFMWHKEINWRNLSIHHCPYTIIKDYVASGHTTIISIGLLLSEIDIHNVLWSQQPNGKPLMEGLVSPYVDSQSLSIWELQVCWKYVINHVRNSGNTCSHEKKDKCHTVCWAWVPLTILPVYLFIFNFVR